MNSSIWLAMSATSLLDNPPATQGLVIGLAAGAILCAPGGVVSTLIARRTGSMATAVLIHLPFGAVGFLLMIVGLTCFLLRVSPKVSIGLLAGGFMVLNDSIAFLLVARQITRRR